MAGLNFRQQLARGGLQPASLIAVALAWLGAGCTPSDPVRPLGFVDRAPALHLDHVSRCGGPEKLWILENLGTGCALLDANGDGRLDVFLANAGVVEDGQIRPGPGPAFYLQGPAGELTEATGPAGLTSRTWQTGVAVGDIENDGDQDLLVAGFGRQALYLNDGRGVFTDVAAERGVDLGLFASSAAFFDYDRDGLLDLYLTGYVRFDPAHPPNGGRPCLQNGVEIACGPGHCEPEEDHLFHNEGGRRFVDVSQALGIASAPGGYGLGVAPGDFDGDGWTDLYVANDTTANFLWRNVEGRRFEEVALASGAALSETGQGQAGMGVAVGDLDGDGKVDIIVTNFSEEPNACYRNVGQGAFEDISVSSGIAAESYPLLGWGAQLVDLDNDSDLDLVVANGHVYPQIPRVNPGLAYLQRCSFFLNSGQGIFTEVGGTLGSDALKARAHRALSAGDLDRDGDFDLLLSVVDGPPVLLRNEASRLGGWVQLELQGTRSSRDAAGARVRAEVAGHELLREASTAGSYLSASAPTIHLGLGGSSHARNVRVAWLGGAVESFGDLKSGARYRLVEGTGKAEALSP